MSNTETEEAGAKRVFSKKADRPKGKLNVKIENVLQPSYAPRKLRNLLRH